jgi:CDP-2,3-bis-(O-geranylgeranyl)-sn-glycerol synthase
MNSFIAMAILLVLIGAANTAPLVAKYVLGARGAWPVDGGLAFFDGRPLLGKAKTLRGVLLGTLVPALLAPFLGYTFAQGITIGAAAMAGDLVSSFIKRRLGYAPSSQSIGLDQILEVLLPALIARSWFGLTGWDIVYVVVAFIVLALWLSKLLYRLRLRDEPY